MTVCTECGDALKVPHFVFNRPFCGKICVAAWLHKPRKPKKQLNLDVP